jgi:hypothetical protein
MHARNRSREEVYGRGNVDRNEGGNLEDQGSEAGGGCHASERGLAGTSSGRGRSAASGGCSVGRLVMVSQMFEGESARGGTYSGAST